MKIKDLVRTDFQIVSPDIRYSEVKDLHNNQSYIVVIESGVFKGILLPHGDDWQKEGRVGDIVNGSTGVDFDSDISDVFLYMEQTGDEIVPVFKSDHFAGVVSKTDLLQALLTYCKELEIRISQSNSDQSRMIGDLQSELQEHKNLVGLFSQYKESAESVLRTKSDFVADISHELRNPLHVILSYTKQGLKHVKKSKDDKTSNIFTKIESCGEQMLMLINDLLELARLESGKSTYHFRDESISELVETILSEFKYLFQSKGLSVYFERPEFDDQVKIDKSRILQVIRNLVSNAYKFSSISGHIKIEMAHIENEICLSLIDWGCGIPEDEFDKLFYKYSRTSNSSGNTPGTGLGLSIAQKIIEHHSGRIYAKANPEGGCIFTFTLPKSYM